jgi:hypothetical protein
MASQHTQISALNDALQANGFQTKIWQNERIYLQNLGLGVDAIIRFSDPARPAAACTTPMKFYEGCSLKVFSTDKVDEHPQAGIDRCKFAKHSIMGRLRAAGIIPGPVPLRWQDVTL